MRQQAATDPQQVYAMLDALQLRAASFIRQHAGAHLYRNQLIERTVAYLRDVGCDMASDETLHRATIRALTEIEANGQTWTIDVDETTTFQVALRHNASKTLRIFTVKDLMRLCNGRLPAAGAV